MNQVDDMKRQESQAKYEEIFKKAYYNRYSDSASFDQNRDLNYTNADKVNEQYRKSNYGSKTGARFSNRNNLRSKGRGKRSKETANEGLLHRPNWPYPGTYAAVADQQRPDNNKLTSEGLLKRPNWETPQPRGYHRDQPDLKDLKPTYPTPPPSKEPENSPEWNNEMDKILAESNDFIQSSEELFKHFDEEQDKEDNQEFLQALNARKITEILNNKVQIPTVWGQFHFRKVGSSGITVVKTPVIKLDHRNFVDE